MLVNLATLVFFIIIPLAFGFWTNRIAKAKNRDSRFWLIAGLFLGPIALIMIMVLPSKQ